MFLSILHQGFSRILQTISQAILRLLQFLKNKPANFLSQLNSTTTLAALVPVITKRLQKSSIARNKISTNCSSLFPEGYCALCYLDSKDCIICTKTCNSDEFQDVSEYTCVKCSIEHNDSNCTRCNSKYCTQCKNGYYLDNNNKCVKCPKGYYCYQNGESSLKSPCQKGYIAPSEGMSSCIACDKSTNTIQGSVAVNTAMTSCTLCTNGYYASTQDRSVSCNICLSGYYCPDGKLIPCSKGYYCPQGSSSQKTCTAGTYSQAGSIDCTTCPKGTYSNSGASSCTKCTAGYYSSKTGASTCTKCSAGYYSNAGASSCSVCPSNHYCPQGTSTPLKCPDGYTSDQGSKVSSDCKSPFDCATYGGTVLNNYCYKITETPVLSATGQRRIAASITGGCYRQDITYYSHSSEEKKYSTQLRCNAVVANCNSVCTQYTLQARSAIGDKMCKFDRLPSPASCKYASYSPNSLEAGNMCVVSDLNSSINTRNKMLYSICITDLN